MLQRLSSFTSDELNAMWDFLHACLMEDAADVLASGDWALSIGSIVSVVALAAVSTTTLPSESIPVKAVEAVKILGGLLPLVVSEKEKEDESIKNDIFLACEAWTRMKLPGSDVVSDEAFLYLLKRSLGRKGTVRKVLSRREMVQYAIHARGIRQSTPP